MVLHNYGPPGYCHKLLNKSPETDKILQRSMSDYSTSRTVKIIHYTFKKHNTNKNTEKMKLGQRQVTMKINIKNR